MEINDINSATNAAYGYLLYLMGDYEKAKEYMEKQIKLDEETKYENKWTWIYYSILNKKLGNDEIAESALLKAVEYTNTAASLKYILKQLVMMKNTNDFNVECCDKFAKLLAEKLK